MKRVFLLLLLLMLGCSGDPVETMKSDNPNFEYEYLFTIKEENVRIYRFRDGTYSRYVAVGNPKQQVSASWEDLRYQSTGKSGFVMAVPQMIDTVRR